MQESETPFQTLNIGNNMPKKPTYEELEQRVLELEKVDFRRNSKRQPKIDPLR
jgi:hypothetical protein